MAARMMLIVMVMLAAAPSMAAALPDPTALPVVSAATGEGERPVSLLTAIKVSGKQKTAIIDGQEFALGERYQGARLVRISESEVELRRGREITVLKLYPQVDKRQRGK